MINLYFHAAPVDQFKTWIWKDGNRYCLRLSDIGMFQASNGKYTAHAGYKPLFEITRHPGQIVVAIHLRDQIMLSVIGKHPGIEVIHGHSE